MSLSSISIQRPVLATVMNIVILLFGFIGLTYLGVREFPSVDTPIITVTTNYVGANADVIESQITEPLEEAVNGIAGIRSLVSTSRDGRSTLRVEFELEVSLEEAANDVRDKVAGAVNRLPADADPPIVAKSDADASPIIFLNIKSDKRSLVELTDIAERTFKERFQTIPGVSEIRIWGERRYAMRLWLDPAKLAAYGLTPLDVQQALQRQNLELPAGAIEGNTMELTIRTLGRLETIEDFNRIIVKEQGGSIVYFGDVGKAELGSENVRTVLKRDGIPMVGNAIIPQPGSNHIEIADEFYRRLEQIKKDLPADIETGIGFDTTRFIRSSISEVEETVYLAFGLVVLIIFLFERLAHDHHPGGGDPDLVGRVVLHHVSGRVLHQCVDVAGNCTRHRTGGGRCHRGAGKHLHQDRGRHESHGGQHGRVEGDLLCRYRHNGGLGGGVPACDIPARTHRTAVPRIWGGACRCGSHQFVCGVDADAHAGIAHSEKTRTPERLLPRH
jgi:multidrug efflux pump